MFFRYLSRELRRRSRQAIVVSLGLAVGIGLVVAVSAMSSGVQQAQGTVLQSLYGVGTDITVTRSGTDGPPAGGFRVGAGSDTQKVSRDQVLTSPGQATFSAEEAETIAGLDGVSDAVGGLNLSVIHISGKLPTFTIQNGQGNATAGSTAAPGAQPSANVTPGQFNVSPSSVAGVDVSDVAIGPLSGTTLGGGRSFTASDAKADVAILDADYAQQKSLGVGDTLKIGPTEFTIVGLVSPTTQGGGSDVYIPLAKAQALADAKGKINTVYVKATSSTTIAAAKRSIQQDDPRATVSTSSDLAKQVTGSLSSAANLASKLGSWLSIAALFTAIVLATLLTLAAVGRRTREIGTLRALGWRTRRVVGQIMGETVVLGVFGGALGIALGIAGAWAVTKMAPSLTATVSGLGNAGGGQGGPGFVAAGGDNAFTRTISVVLHAPISMGLVGAAVGLALAGGVIAGLFGGWRAARLRPADAMRQVV